MPLFHYRAYAKDGSLKAGKIEASDNQNAIDQLYGQGLIPFETTQGAGAAVRWWEKELFSSGGVSGKELAAFTRELSTLLNAEIPLDETLRIVAAQSASTKMKNFCRELLDQIVSGATLSKALASQEQLPGYYISLVRVGEASGSLGPVIEQLAAFIEHSEDIKARIQSALIYPFILLGMSVAAVILISMFLIPNLKPVFDSSGAPTPFFIDLVLWLRSSILNWWPVWCGSAAIMLFSIVSLFRNPKTRRSVDRIMLRIPVLGAIISEIETGRFSRALGIMFGNGVPLLQALQIVKSTAGNKAFAEALASGVDQIKEGRRLHDALAKTGVFPDLSLRLIKVGEQSARLDEMLIHAANIFEASVQRKINRIMTWFSPIMTLLIGLGVGGLIMSVMNAILSVNELAL